MGMLSRNRNLGWLWLAVCTASAPAFAETTWDTIHTPVDAVAEAVTDSSMDPFGTDKKIAPYHRLRPINCPGAPDTNRKLTLGEIVIAALCHNPDTKAAYLDLLANAATYGGNYSAYLPTVSGTYNRSRTNTFNPNGLTIVNSSGITAEMTLYDFGRRELTIEAAEHSLIAAGLSFDSTLQGMIATALQSYYQLLTAQNALTVARESERYARESYDAARLRHEIGQVPLADELQAKGAYSQAQLATQTAENQLYQNQASLAILIGIAADTPLAVAEMDDSQLTKEPFTAELKTLIEKAKESRVDLEAARAGIRGSEASLKALKRSNLATVTAGVSMGFDDADIFNNQTGRDQTIGLSVSIPIFSGFSHTYAEKAAERNLDAQRQRFVTSELGVERDVFSAWHNYETARKSWETSWDQLASATQLRDVALGRYKEGIGTILDVLNAQSQYSSALQNQLSARYNLLTARVDLVRAVGVLNLENMHPQEPVNPSASLGNLPVQPFAFD